jgi:geranylgeranyl pyrophosphate synthase
MDARFGSESVSTALKGLVFRLPERSSVPEIESLLNRSVLWGGKRLRPLLTFLVADSLGIPLDGVSPYARAAEYTHAATLAHDDVIDEAATRRHRPTINSRSSNSRAVLAGDFLLAQALRELCVNPSARLISGLSQVLVDMVSGEWLQLEARGVVEVSAQHLDEVARKKTASLLAWCCSVGPELKGLEPALVDRFRQLGNHLGLAFQQVDDVIDFEREGEKPFAQDVREGLVNRVTYEMIRANPTLVKPLQRTIQLWRDDPLAAAKEHSWPWSDEELQSARQLVRISAEAHIEAGRELWRSLISELHLDSESASVRAIFSILDELPRRKA